MFDMKFDLWLDVLYHQLEIASNSKQCLSERAEVFSFSKKPSLSHRCMDFSPKDFNDYFEIPHLTDVGTAQSAYPVSGLPHRLGPISPSFPVQRFS